MSDNLRLLACAGSEVGSDLMGEEARGALNPLTNPPNLLKAPLACSATVTFESDFGLAPEIEKEAGMVSVTGTWTAGMVWVADIWTSGATH